MGLETDSDMEEDPYRVYQSDSSYKEIKSLRWKAEILLGIGLPLLGVVVAFGGMGYGFYNSRKKMLSDKIPAEVRSYDINKNGALDNGELESMLRDYSLIKKVEGGRR